MQGHRGVQLPAAPPAQPLRAPATIRPAVNQIEVSPYLAQDELRAFDAEHEIVTEAWSPIARGKVADDPVIGRIAERLGRSPAQVTLRWHVQRGDVVFPKSVTRSRIEENFAIFDFELDDARHGRDLRPRPRRAHRPEPGRVQLRPRLSAFRCPCG